MLEVLECGARRLQRWREVHERDFPRDKHTIADPDCIDIGKLGGGAVTTDNCNPNTTPLSNAAHFLKVFRIGGEGRNKKCGTRNHLDYKVFRIGGEGRNKMCGDKKPPRLQTRQ